MKKFIAMMLSMLMILSIMNIPVLAEEEAAPVALPTATVTELNVADLSSNEGVALTYALRFTADEATDEQLEEYGNWYADFVFTMNKNATFNSNGDADGYLAGSYENWSEGAWISVPFEDVTIEADVPVKIMEVASTTLGQPGLKMRYDEVYETVQSFDCGVYFDAEYLLANPDLVTTLELRIYNPENLEESYTIGEVYEYTIKTNTTEENVVIQGTMSTGNTVEIQDINTESAAEGTTTVTIDTNTFVDESATDAVVDTVKIPVAAVETVEALGEDATLNITLANGEAEDITVSINKDALTAIKEAASAEGTTDIVLKVEKAEDEELESEQQEQVSALDNTHVYTISFETADGTEVYTEDTVQEGREIKVNIPYVQVGNGRVIAKYLKDDGTLEDVDYTYANGVVTLTLTHFSDYVIYQKTASSVLTPVGSNSASKYTVRFDTDGGSAVASQTVDKNSQIDEPAAPTKDGYTFEGWYTDNSFTTAYDFETAVTKGFTLYAKWAEEAKTDDEPKDDTDTDADVAESWFVDVADADWYYDDVKYVNDNKLMNGVTDTTFAPDGLLTRGMLVTILYRNEGEPAVNRSIPFADIDLGAYYANAVIWAQQNGIVNGVTETEFAPDENITREQIAAIMFRYAISKGLEAVTLEENLTAFADEAEISEYAISAMNWAVGSGLMKGKTESTLNPKDNTTRAEVAAVIRRYIEGNAQN